MATEMERVTIDELRGLAKRRKLPAVIVLYTDGENIGYTSYGHDRKACDATHKLAEKLFALAQCEDLFWALRDVLVSPNCEHDWNVHFEGNPNNGTAYQQCAKCGLKRPVPEGKAN